ncbi:RmlC-like cupin domain-containing protein [Xylaria acuta]|nr:RmlC-like cupin domain-containing protein [Xylaria acuta]
MQDVNPAEEGIVPPNDLPPQRRVITAHTTDGTSIFDSSLPEETPIQVLSNKAAASLAYAVQIPPTFTDDADIGNYTRLLKDPPGLTISDSAVLRWYDIGPGVESPLHRTMSIDYLVVLFGYLELVLDSGETRTLRPGDVVIQRGTMHSWKNITSGWARTLAVTIPVHGMIVGGQSVGEDLGSIEGFKKSE